jgi:hypothetical protein
MSDWRVVQHYGFGAARVRLCPEPCGLPAPDPWAPGRALRALAAELRAAGVRAGLAGGLRLLPGLALGTALVLALFLTSVREHPDADLRVVRFETPAPKPPPAPPLPEIAPLPEPVPPPPPLPTLAAPVRPPAEPPPVLAQAPRTAPEPPPVRARAPRSAPAAPPRASPLRARPSLPAVPQLARQEPVSRPAAPQRSLPAVPAAPRPDVRIDGVARAEAPPVTLPAPAEPPSPDLASRGSRPLAAPRPALDLAMPASPAPASPASPAPPGAGVRRPQLRPEPSGRAERPQQLAVAALPGAAREASAAVRPAAGRVDREAPELEARRGAAEPRLAGVALGSLAACVSDRREDELKLRVMAERGAAGECASSAGRYRFVETRNLNAFLMWVERAPARPEADRCVELSLALDCLAHSRRRSREI